MSLELIATLVIVGVTIVSAFVTVQVTLWYHLADCQRYRIVQTEAFKEISNRLADVNDSVTRLVAQMEYEQRRGDRPKLGG